MSDLHHAVSPSDAGPQLSLFDAPAAATGEPCPTGLDNSSPGATPSQPAAPHRLFVHPRANRRIRLDHHWVGYELRRAQRRSIGFIVGDEGLCVAAPRWIGQPDIDAALQTKARWILRKLVDQGERLNRLAAARVEWRDGVELPYFGEPLRVQLDAQVDGAVLDSQASPRVLRIGLAATAAPTQIRDAVQSWLQRQALQCFRERCAHFARELGVQVRQIRLSSAQTRWGSATSNGTIRLHWRLVHFAPTTIDYVVAHELAHLREMNHSPAFWDVVRSVMPDFEAARGALQQHHLPVFD